jgi:hypothetical protein
MTADPTACAQSQLPDPGGWKPASSSPTLRRSTRQARSTLGLGWSTTITPLPAQAVVILIKVPWNQANRAHKLRAELLTQDGQPVAIPGPIGDQPVTIEGDFEAARPPGLPAGTPLDLAFVFSLQQGIQLPRQVRVETVDRRHMEKRLVCGLLLREKNTVSPLWGPG